MINRLKILIQKLAGIVAYLPRTLSLVWRATPQWTSLWLALLMMQGVLPAGTVWLTKVVVDALVHVFKAGQGWEGTRPVWPAIILLAGLVLLGEILQNANVWVRAQQSESLKDHLSELIQAKSASIDYAFYELAEYHDHLHRARDESSYRPLAMLESLGNLLQQTITLAAMLILLLPLGWWMPGLLLLSTLPAVAIMLHSTLRYYEWQRQVTEKQRRASYYEWMLTTRETAAEVRVFNLSDAFRRAFRKTRSDLRKAQLNLVRDQSLAQLAASLVAMLALGSGLAWMAWQALLGMVTLGMLAMFYQAFNQGQQLLRSMLASVGQFYSNGLYLKDLFEFLELPSSIKDPDVPVKLHLQAGRTLQFEDVTFCYPGSERQALRDFSLTVGAGQVVAIVGFNGAGKTTLIKLLCRLYDPLAGAIKIDGVDLRDLRLEDLRQQLTVLFQQPVQYQATLAENIHPAAVNEFIDLTVIQKAAQAAGLDEIVTRLPQGFDSQLGKWFTNGSELSGGEWQRLALARAFLRAAPVLLLDEPTSAMDAWAETEWLRRFRSLMAGRTVLLITHRFTTAMHADHICVMSDGQIIEQGSHQKLLALDGRYAQSWREQAQLSS